MAPSASERVREISAAVVSSSSIPLATNFLEHVKTRMQSRPAPGSTATAYPPTFIASAHRLHAEEGALAMYSTGLLASVVREAATQLFRFGSYPLVRDVLSRSLYGSSGGDSAVSVKLGAGLLCGAVSGVAASPFDLARIRMQSEAGRISADGAVLLTGLRAGLPPRPQGMAGTLALIAREGGGASALWRGAGVNAVRAAAMNMGTVPVYEHTKHLAKRHLGARDAPSLHFGAGIVAGLVGTTVAAPVDMVRTRLMSGAEAEGVGSAVLRIWAEGGPRGFFRGWWPAYLRSARSRTHRTAISLYKPQAHKPQL